VHQCYITNFKTDTQKVAKTCNLGTTVGGDDDAIPRSTERKGRDSFNTLTIIPRYKALYINYTFNKKKTKKKQKKNKQTNKNKKHTHTDYVV
jgi:hypothetical protein